MLSGTMPVQPLSRKYHDRIIHNGHNITAVYYDDFTAAVLCSESESS
ncbi:hypothetical protein [Morganella morganii IS15]|nr:hypothetical protein CSB69_3543 [Morganella morganii]EMP52666.1 hypothetical protein C790_03639 [Morganella morganii SC01]CDK67947.1 hypothetical protein [Morganella morganii IS15]